MSLVYQSYKDQFKAYTS